MECPGSNEGSVYDPERGTRRVSKGMKMGHKSLLLVVCVAMAALMAPAASANTKSYECFAEPATILGTPGDDVLIGREDTADVIVGLGGDDIIFGSEDINASTAPGDRLCGGSGDDYIRGGVGEDRVQGGSDEDNVDGSYGYDVITQGGDGDDRVEDCDSEYTGGVRIIKGGGGVDRLCADTDSTRMYGNGGDDLLVDLTCRNEARMHGGRGGDRLESHFDNLGGQGCTDSGLDMSDRLVGGSGLDSAIISPNDTTNEIEMVETR
jgi:Ca2+-binding RTX toxin-like protein